MVGLCAQPVHVLEKAVESTTLMKMCAGKRMCDEQEMDTRNRYMEDQKDEVIVGVD